MDEFTQSPEDLIAGMNPDEICELLEEIGIEATSDEAEMIQDLIEELGSLEEALQALASQDGQDRKAA